MNGPAAVLVVKKSTVELVEHDKKVEHQNFNPHDRRKRLVQLLGVERPGSLWSAPGRLRPRESSDRHTRRTPHGSACAADRM